MARNQTYRGNPEQKLYSLFNDFSGGINSTSTDELVYTNEFRNLLNVDLLERGRIQNRKGFSYMKNLNEWFTDSLIKLPNDNIYLFKVLSDDKNILSNIEKYKTLDDFKTENSFNFSVHTVIIYRDGNTIKVDNISFLNDTQGDWTFFIARNNYFTYSVSTFKSIKINGVDNVKFSDSLLININDLSDELEGFIKITLSSVTVIGEDTPHYETISKDNAYIPNPYEISNIGFNLLHPNPLNNIRIDAQGIAEIRGAYVTLSDDYNKPLAKLPPSGSFMLHVITKGTYQDDNLPLANQLIIQAYTENSSLAKVLLETTFSIAEQDAGSSIIRFLVNIRLENSPTVFIEIKKEIAVELDTKKTETTLQALVDFFKNKTASDKRYLVKTGTKYYTMYVPMANDVIYNYKTHNFNTYTCTNQIVWTAEARSSSNMPLVKMNSSTVMDDSPKYPEFAETVQYVIIHQTNPSTSYYTGIFYFNGSGTPVVTVAASCYTSMSISGGLVNNIEDYSLTVNDILEVEGVPSTYYNWKGTNLGTTADFLATEVITTETIMSYISVYDVGIDITAKKIESIVLKNFRMVAINDRLVIYTGNTILFSDQFIYNYFPNYNYIVLSLIGNDYIQKIAYFRGSWIIFTRERIYRMSGDLGSGDLKIVLINDSIGCISPDSVRGVNNTLIFLSADGLYTIKQNFYMEGIENVEKVDNNIRDIIPYGLNYESVLYNEQYLLFIKDRDNNYIKTIKQYYNMAINSKTFPYAVDIYAKPLKNLFKIDNNLFSIKNGTFYVYDVGYTDFEPNDIGLLESERIQYFYKMSIETPNYALGYSTHDKKFKNIYIKTDSISTVPIYITIFVNNTVWLTPYQFMAELNEQGEIEYREILNKVSSTVQEAADSNLILSEVVTDVNVIDTIDPDLALGAFVLGQNTLGMDRYQVHKLLAGSKGKSIALKIEQKLDEYFAVETIGFLYKLGKVKESR